MTSPWPWRKHLQHENQQKLHRPGLLHPHRKMIVKLLPVHLCPTLSAAGGWCPGQWKGPEQGTNCMCHVGVTEDLPANDLPSWFVNWWAIAVGLDIPCLFQKVHSVEMHSNNNSQYSSQNYRLCFARVRETSRIGEEKTINWITCRKGSSLLLWDRIQNSCGTILLFGRQFLEFII